MSIKLIGNLGSTENQDGTKIEGSVMRVIKGILMGSVQPSWQFVVIAKKKGHAKCCHFKPIRSLEEKDDNRSNIDLEGVHLKKVYGIKVFKITNGKRIIEWIEPLKINGQIVNAKLDTGAMKNCMSESTFKKLALQDPLDKRIDDVRLISFSNHIIRPLEKIKGKCRIWKTEYEIEFFVIKDNVQTILGIEDIIRTKLVTRNSQPQEMFPVVSDWNKQKVEDKYENSFNGIGCLPDEHKIRLKKNAVPVVSPPEELQSHC